MRSTRVGSTFCNGTTGKTAGRYGVDPFAVAIWRRRRRLLLQCRWRILTARNRHLVRVEDIEWEASSVHQYLPMCLGVEPHELLLVNAAYSDLMCTFVGSDPPRNSKRRRLLGNTKEGKGWSSRRMMHVRYLRKHAHVLHRSHWILASIPLMEAQEMHTLCKE